MSIIRQVLILVLIAGIGAGGYYGYQHYYGEIDLAQLFREKKSGGGGGRGRSADRVEVVEAKVETVRDTIEAVGTSRAYQAIEVVALAAGRIVDIVAQPGQEVQKGDPLFRLDDDIEKANLTEAKAKLLKARSFLERSRTLRESKYTSQASLDQVRADAASAEAEVGRAERRLADRVVRAAFAGRVGLNKVEVGARVDSNTVLTTLDDVSKVEIEFQLPEIVFGRTKIGMKAIGESAAFPGQKFVGTIEHVDTRIDRTSRTFLVRARIPNPDRRLPAGMFMRLSLILDERQAMTVSEEAVVAEGTESLVFVVKNGKAERRQVKIGQRKPGIVEIAEGLKPGEIVVSRGLERLRDGKPVRVVGGPAADKVQRAEGAAPGGKGASGKRQLAAKGETDGSSKAVVANGPVTHVKEGGKQLVWRTDDGKLIELAVSGSQTQITIDGKKAESNNIKVGMLCRAKATADGRVALSIDCKEKSGA
jgi:membrane fusion protein (multidrug efflux system)